MSLESEYEKKIEDLLSTELPKRSKDMFYNLMLFGNYVVHEPTGISGYSIGDVNEKLIRHYQSIIDSQLHFIEIKKVKNS